MMAGPVIGIIVTGETVEPVSSTSDERRHLRLVARVDTGGTEAEPAFGITVVNELPEPTSVHWHGIELESYYDGVAGFAGEGNRIAPAIEPGGSFEARFTPRRSGIFSFITHIDEVRQQQAGR